MPNYIKHRTYVCESVTFPNGLTEIDSVAGVHDHFVVRHDALVCLSFQRSGGGLSVVILMCTWMMETSVCTEHFHGCSSLIVVFCSDGDVNEFFRDVFKGGVCS